MEHSSPASLDARNSPHSSHHRRSKRRKQQRWFSYALPYCLGVLTGLSALYVQPSQLVSSPVRSLQMDVPTTDCSKNVRKLESLTEGNETNAAQENESLLDVEELDVDPTGGAEANGENDSTAHSSKKDAPSLPTPGMSKVVAGMSHISRREFIQRFRSGHPFEKEIPGNQDVLVLYQTPKSMPSNPEDHSVDGALQNCQSVNVVYANPAPTGKRGIRDQCVAIVGQWESGHVQKWTHRRRRKDFVRQPFHHTDVLPSTEHQESNRKIMMDYLTTVEEAKDELKVVLGEYTTDEPLIVMVTNQGQATLLSNFVCTARARNFSLDRIIVFATDEATQELATQMGLHVYYNPQLFSSIPTRAATGYADEAYGRIMMSKVYCVHLVNALGYDVLFQDVDIVWYQHPLQYFATDVDPSFDMYFQFDGHHRPARFAPLAANTGFYYVRNNARTRYFFDVFVRMGDLVLTDKSHQAALTTLVNEHASVRGLRVQVLSDDTDLFLSGFHLHAEPRLLRAAVNGSHKPYIYHVNWMDGHRKKPSLIETNNWYLDCEVGASCCRSEPLPWNKTMINEMKEGGQ